MTPTQPPPAPAQPWPHPFPPPLILPPEQPARFQLGPASLAVLAVCVLMHVRAGLSHWQRTPLAASQDIGVFVFGFLVSIALGWLCWRLAPRKHAGEVVFCFLMLLFAGSRTLENASTNARARVRAQQAQQTQRTRDRQRAAAASRVPPAAPRPATSVPVAEQAAPVPPVANLPLGGGTGSLQEFNRRRTEVTAAMASVMGAKVQAYEAAAAQLKAAGAGSARGLDTLDAIVQRRRLTRAALDTNTTLTIACQTVEGDLLAALRGAVPEADAQETTRRMMAAFEPAASLRIRDCERRCLEGIDGELALFQQEFTRWHLDADQKIVFDNPAVNPWYTRWATQLRDAGEEGTRLRRELAARHPAGR